MENTEPSNSLVVFIALWDEDYGPMLEDVFPKVSPYNNIESMATNIFMTFQTIFGEAVDVSFKKMSLTIPFKSENCVARIQLDVVPNEDVRAGLQPFIVVTLIPGDLDEQSLISFDSVLEKIANLYKETKSVSLQNYIMDIENLFNIAQQVEDLDISLEKGYDLQAAIVDFKSGIELIQKKKYKVAYPILKQALLKFELEKQDNFTMETSYMLGTLLIQLKKYVPAIKHFKSLASLAEIKNVQKYKELFRFMLGLCYYKLNNYQKAFEYLTEIKIGEAKFVNKLQYYSIITRTKMKLEKFQESIEDMKTFIEILNQIDRNPTIDMQIAQTHYDLGFTIYNWKIREIKDKQLKSIKEVKEEVAPWLLESIENFKIAAKIWEDSTNYPQLLPTLEIIAEIYHILEEPKKEIVFLEKAFMKSGLMKNKTSQTKFMRRINTITKKFEITSELLEKPTMSDVLSNKEAHNTKETIDTQKIKNNDNLQEDSNGSKTKSLSEMYSKTELTGTKDSREEIEDEITIIAIKHIDRGKKAYEDKNHRRASIEFINALNILNRMKFPSEMEVESLEWLIKLNKETNENDKANYYSTQLEKTKQKLHSLK